MSVNRTRHPKVDIERTSVKVNLQSTLKALSKVNLQLTYQRLCCLKLETCEENMRKKSNSCKKHSFRL